MFQSLRQGSSIWVMDKSNLTLQVCSVVSTTLPTAGYSQLQWLPQAIPGQTMDVTVQMEDGTQGEFKQLNPSQTVAQYGNIIVAETAEVMAREIENLDRQSQQILESVQFHTKARTAYEEMKRKLSPSYAKQKQNDDRLNVLEQNQAQIVNNQQQLASGISAIREMLNKMNGNTPANNHK